MIRVTVHNFGQRKCFYDVLVSELNGCTLGCILRQYCHQENVKTNQRRYEEENSGSCSVFSMGTNFKSLKVPRSSVQIFVWHFKWHVHFYPSFRVSPERNMCWYEVCMSATEQKQKILRGHYSQRKEPCSSLGWKASRTGKKHYCKNVTHIQNAGYRWPYFLLTFPVSVNVRWN